MMTGMDGPDSLDVAGRSSGGAPQVRIEPAKAETDAQRALRAQLLATEHWSLLASRSTTQSEILSRMTIFLTLVSAGLVTLGLLGQTGDGDRDLGWTVAGVLAFLFVLGIMTQFRVINAMTEDLMYVAAMNRLRGAYVELDPEVGRNLMASTFDDDPGIETTYFFFGSRRDRSQVFASLGIFVQTINIVLAGLLVGSALAAGGAASAVAAFGGIAAALVVLLLDVYQDVRAFRGALAGHTPLRLTPGPRP